MPAEMLSTAQLVDNLTGADEGPTPDGLIQAVSDKVYAKARDSLGPAWSTYQRLKFEAVMNRLADEVNRCFGSARPSAKAGGSPGHVSTTCGKGDTHVRSAICCDRPTCRIANGG